MFRILVIGFGLCLCFVAVLLLFCRGCGPNTPPAHPGGLCALLRGERVFNPVHTWNRDSSAVWLDLLFTLLETLFSLTVRLWRVFKALRSVGRLHA